MTDKNNMRTRDEIQKQTSRSYRDQHEERDSANENLIIELLLDIRDLLTNHEQ